MKLSHPQYPDCLFETEHDPAARALITALASGGDARITLDPQTGLNKYFSAPYPRKTLAYASSTANDLSHDAFEHLREFAAGGVPAYGEHLDDLRARIREAYGLSDDVEVVFAPSGTDLEYVALAAFQHKAEGGVHNILLGADEVGSGCIHSAHGRYFAGETALGFATEKSQPVKGFGPISLADVPVRCMEGIARNTREIHEMVEREIMLAQANSQHALVHVVHGSKTGLILPERSELDRLRERFGEHHSLVVDACQARIKTNCVQDYIARGAIVFLTGSKFMGGAPFNGFALVPRSVVEDAAELPEGLSKIFRRAEFPIGWAGRDKLADSENPGLALRFEGSVFELARFQQIPVDQVGRIVEAFQEALREHLAKPLGLRVVTASPDPDSTLPAAFPLEMQTLATLDVSHLPRLDTFDDAVIVHRELAFAGLRLGQPVKCVRKEGRWGGTMRVGLSMPQVTRFNAMGIEAAKAELAADMQRIARILESAAHS